MFQFPSGRKSNAYSPSCVVPSSGEPLIRKDSQKSRSDSLQYQSFTQSNPPAAPLSSKLWSNIRFSSSSQVILGTKTVTEGSETTSLPDPVTAVTR